MGRSTCPLLGYGKQVMVPGTHVLIVADAPRTADSLLRACHRAGLVFSSWCVSSSAAIHRLLPLGDDAVALVAIDGVATDGVRHAVRTMHEVQPCLPILLVSLNAAVPEDSLAQEPGVVGYAPGADAAALLDAWRRATAPASGALAAGEQAGDPRRGLALAIDEAFDGSRALLEALVAHAPIGIAVVRAADGLVELANSAYWASTGMAQGPICGSRVADLLPARAAAYLQERLDEVVRTGGAVSVRDAPITLAPGQEPMHWHVDYVPLPEADGAVRRVLILARDVTAEMQAPRALAESEARLQALLDALPVGVYIADAQGHIHTANEAGRAIWGADMPRPSSPDAYHTDYPAWWASTGRRVAQHEWALARALASGEVSLEEEIEIDGPDGRRLTVLNYAMPIRDPQGAITGGVSVNVDITARREAERALERRLAELEVLYEASQALLESLDTQVLLQRLCTTVVHAAGLLMAWAGIKTDAHDVPSGLEAVAVAGNGGDTLEQLRRRVSRDTRSRPATEVLRTGAPVLVPNLATDSRFDAAWREEEQAHGHRTAAAFPLLLDREVAGVLVVYAGVADMIGPERFQSLRSLAFLASAAMDRVRLFEQVREYAAALEDRVAERTAALRASESRFRAIFEGAALGVLSLDLEGCIQAVNPAAEAMLGFDAENLRGRVFSRLLTPSGGAHRILSEYQAYVHEQGREPSRQWEARFQRGGGPLRWGALTVTCVENPQGAVQFAILMLEDITEERGARAALMQIERLRIISQLSAALAHEIKNPLQGAIGALQLSQEALASDAHGLSYVNAAIDALWRIDRVVSRLRELHQQPRADDRAPIDVRGLVEQTLLLSEKQRLQARVRTEIDIPDDLPSPMAAGDLVQQALMNLVLNGYEAMVEGGVLTVHARETRDPAGVAIAVQDTGVGIPPEALTKVFDFTYTTKRKGTGLGLFVARDIAQAHRGQLTVQSVLGGGATFTLWLPL